MNRTVVFVAIAGLVAIGLAGIVILMALGVDAAAFIGALTSLLSITITAGVTFYGLDKLNQGQKVIANSVNGNTAKLLEIADRSADGLTESERAKIVENMTELGKVGDH